MSLLTRIALTIAEDFAVACVLCACATFIIAALVNVLRHQRNNLEDLIRRAIPAGSIPIGILLLAIALNPDPQLLDALSKTAGARVCLGIASLGVFYIVIRGIFASFRE